MSKWIRCKDSLPMLHDRQTIKESHFYLVCDSLGVCNIAKYREDYFYKYNGWYERNNNRLLDIVAWMPIPEPYREERNNGR